MAAQRRGAAGGIVAALVVGYLGMIVLGSYVFGGAVVDAMRTQQTADVVANLPHQEVLMASVAHERAYATVVDRACAPNRPDCEAANQARTALLDGVPELDKAGRPVVDDDGSVSFAHESAVQLTGAALDRRDQAIGALDVGMLDAQVRDTIELTLADRAAVDQVHSTVESSAGQAIKAYDMYLQDSARLNESLAETTDGELRAHLEAQLLLAELALAVLQERPLVSLSLGAFEFGQPGYLEPAVAQVTAVDEQVATAQDALGRAGSAQQVPAIDGELTKVRSAVLSGELAAVTPAQAQGFASASAAWFGELRTAQDALRLETIELAQDQANAATNRALLTGAVTAGVLVLGLAAVITVSVLLLRRRPTPTPPPAGWKQPVVPAVQR